MKVILSRKGFDSVNGKMPSAIMPNGDVVSFPIPSGDKTTFDELIRIWIRRVGRKHPIIIGSRLSARHGTYGTI